jgi:Domain of unknown function (DUF5666)/Carboxypeptidase regulatory-like domain
MRVSSRIRRTWLVLLGSLAVLLFNSSCGDSDRSPTSPGMATLSGTVIRGTTTSGMQALGMEIGLAGVTVRVTSTGKSTQTDGSGNFAMTGVPAGAVELTFERADIHARATVSVAAGATNTVTIAIVGSSAVVVPRGHAGEEIEGLVSVNDGSSLTVLDQRLGAAVVHTDGSTVVRSGSSAIPLSQIAVGMRVHVKAVEQTDHTYLATEILLQSEKVGGSRQVSGTVLAVDSGNASFVVQAGAGTVTVKTDSSTTFRRRGSSASFADVTTGASVDVNGVLQADGTVLARKVTIEG